MWYDAYRGWYGILTYTYKLMHSSTGYGLTTSNSCMSVTQKRAADDEVLQPFSYAQESFPALCPCGEHAPGRDAAAAAEHPSRLAGLHKRHLRRRRTEAAAWRSQAAAHCAAGGDARAGRCGEGAPEARGSRATSCEQRERRRPLCLFGPFSRPRENEPWQRSCWPPATLPLCTFLPYRYLI